MSNDIVLFRDKNATLPLHLTRGVDDLTKSLMGGGGNTGKRISIMGGVWRMIVGGEELAKIEDRSIDVVIVSAAAKNSRSFYEGAYSEESKGKLPDCWSNDGVKPDAKANSPQHNSCVGCPQNVAGSGQGTSRACRFSRRLAVVMANDIHNSEVYQLVLPAQSIFGKVDGGKMPLEAYANFIGGNGLSISSIVTELKFDTASATPKIIFRAVRPLSEDEMEVVIEKGKSQDATQAITFNPAQSDKSKPAPVAIAAPQVVEEVPVFRDAPAPKAQPKKEVEVAEEPVVRAKPKAEPAKDLEDVLSAWGDDE